MGGNHVTGLMRRSIALGSGHRLLRVAAVCKSDETVICVSLR